MDWLVTLIREIGVEETRRIIGALIFLIGGYGIYLIIRRGNKDGDLIRQLLAREQQRNAELERRVNELERQLKASNEREHTSTVWTDCKSNWNTRGKTP